MTDRQLHFLVVLNVLILAAATIAVGPSFVSLYNLQSMAGQVPELGLLAIGVMLAMVSGNGGIDLSGIALANLTGVASGLTAMAFVSADTAPWTFTLIFACTGLLVGLAGGLLNGVLIAHAGLTPIIATLGTQLLFTGIAVVLTNGSALGLGWVEPLDAFGNAPILGIPICFLVFLAVALLVGTTLRFTPFGTRLYLLGTNAKAARYAGIAQKRILLVTYTACGVIASIAGIIIASRTASMKWDYGTSYVLIAILIAVMAGVRPEGGHGRVACVVLSASALQILASMFNFLDISNFFRDCAWGLLLLATLAISRFALRSRIPARLTATIQTQTNQHKKI